MNERELMIELAKAMQSMAKELAAVMERLTQAWKRLVVETTAFIQAYVRATYRLYEERRETMYKIMARMACGYERFCVTNCLQ